MYITIANIENVELHRIADIFGGQNICGLEANHENFTREISKSVLYCD